MKHSMMSKGMLTKEQANSFLVDNKTSSAKHQFFQFVYQILVSVPAAKNWAFTASVYNKMEKAELIAKLKHAAKDTRSSNNKKTTSSRGTSQGSSRG